MKEKLLKMLAAKEARQKELQAKRIELRGKSDKSEDLAEIRSITAQLDSINGELDAINIEVTELKSTIAEVKDEVPAGGDTPPAEAQARGASQITNGQILSTFVPNGISEEKRSTDFEHMERDEIFKAPEYRSAYLKSLQKKPLNDIEKRALTTAANSGGAAVPTTTYNMIIEKLRQTSVLFPLINVTYIPGNVDLPVANAVTAAIWSDEAAAGSVGDDTVTKVSLAGYTLAKYAQISAAALSMTIDAFETYIVNQIGKQLSIAVENAILNGKGPTPGGSDKAQPTGIFVGVTFSSSNSLTYSTSVAYDDLVDLRAKIPTMYRTNVRFILNSAMEASLLKIKTSVGQPIFTQIPNDANPQRILGLPYIVDDYMPDNTILLCDLSYYYMNISKAPAIESDPSAGFTSASTYYRGLLVADAKPALSEAFAKLAKA